MRRAMAATALIKEHDPVGRCVEETTDFGVATSAGTTMDKDHRFARWVATFLPV
eukprot:EC713638.1.p5 GENE.EC713638.1~~EC713638.1.p5  ORF type:complete len:54 (-),score=6.25 EC713638.1:338-499(-)